MASENTVEIGFTADTSDFSAGTEDAAASIAALSQQAMQSFAAMGQAIQAMTGPLQIAQDQMQSYNDAVITGAAKAADSMVATQRAAIEQQKALGEISSSDALAQLTDLADQEHRINLQRSDDLKNVALQNNDPIGATNATAQTLVETERYNQQIIKLNTDAAKESEAAWQSAFQPISRAFSSSIDGMVRGTQTLDQTVKKLAQNIVAEYADSAVQSAVHWAASEAQKTLATQAGTAARTASTQGAAAEGLAIEGASNKESVVGNAWSAAAAVYNNVAQIPYVGWVLAPAAAATAAAAVLAFGGSIPSAAGGWVVPNDTMAMVHENEMILPAHLSQGIAGMIASGQGGGGHTFNNTFHVNAGDGVSAKQLPDMIVATMSKAMRNGQFGSMRTT